MLTAPLAAAKMPIIVTSTPEGAEVVIYAHDYGRLGECVTPCRKKVDEEKLSAVEVFKDGYVPRLMARSKAAEKEGKLVFNITMQTLAEYEAEQVRLEALRAVREKAEQARLAAEAAALQQTAAKARLAAISQAEDCPDQNARPDFRLPPKLPSQATKSGHCDMVFDLSKLGEPQNIRATHCSFDIFQAPSVQAILQWAYFPEIRDGRSVPVRDIQVKLHFRVTDEFGKLIPDPAAH